LRGCAFPALLAATPAVAQEQAVAAAAGVDPTLFGLIAAAGLSVAAVAWALRVSAAARDASSIWTAKLADMEAQLEKSDAVLSAHPGLVLVWDDDFQAIESGWGAPKILGGPAALASLMSFAREERDPVVTPISRLLNTLGDLLRPGAFDGGRERLGVMFLVCAVAVAGVPPLAGFMGKAMLLQAAGPTAWGTWSVAVVLASSLLLMVALARSGSVLFWSPAPDARGAPAPTTGAASDALPTATSHRWALGLLLAAVLACSAAAGPLSRYSAATAAQLFERQAYLQAVLQAEPAPAAIDVRLEMRERKVRP